MLRSEWLSCALLLGLLVLASIPTSQANAQASAVVFASEVVTEAFPTLTLYLTVFDGDGNRISGLSSDSFSILEDEAAILDLQVEETQVGTRRIIVINTHSDLKVRDSLGRTRFERIRAALLDWWQRPDVSVLDIDDLTLLTTEGPLVTHSPFPADLASTLDHTTPAYAAARSGYELLLESLDYASDPADRPGMPNFLFFFTALMPTPGELPLANIQARARDTGTVIFPILLGDPETLEDGQAAPLRQLAEETRGELLLFDDQMGLDPLVQRVLAQRTQYRLTYTSQVQQPGSHQLQVRISGEGVEALSNIRAFEVDVRPPEVVFIQPPKNILRSTEDSSLQLRDLPPKETELSLLITFPDGHPRPIQSSRLLVDGSVVSERTQAPFDQFVWDLSGYLESGSHELQVVVEDTLGLEGSTIRHQVDVELKFPPRGLSALRPALGSLLLALAVLAGGMYLAVRVLGLTQNNPEQEGSPDHRLREGRLSLKRASLRRPELEAVTEAVLVLLDSEAREGDAIELTGMEWFLGRDPSLAAVPFEDPSVSGLHAKLTRQADGNYLLRDQGSVAGTWVNYDPIPEDGRLLQHEDLIHLGRVAMRYRRVGAPEPRQIRIIPLDEEMQEEKTS
jgi:hypothetical protein